MVNQRQPLNSATNNSTDHNKPMMAKTTLKKENLASSCSVALDTNRPYADTANRAMQIKSEKSIAKR